MQNFTRFSVLPFILLLFVTLGCRQQDDKTASERKAQGDLQVDKIPQVVMDGLKAKFPKAEIHKWGQEKEGDITVYDIEFEQGGRKLEADIRADGSIHNWEKAIEASDLPEPVKKVVEAKYPKAGIKEIMEIIAVNDGKDALEGYEIVLETADGKSAEVTVAPDGKILEDSGEKKSAE